MQCRAEKLRSLTKLLLQVGDPSLPSLGFSPQELNLAFQDQEFLLQFRDLPDNFVILFRHFITFDLYPFSLELDTETDKININLVVGISWKNL